MLMHLRPTWSFWGNILSYDGGSDSHLTLGCLGIIWDALGVILGSLEARRMLPKPSWNHLGTILKIQGMLGLVEGVLRSFCNLALPCRPRLAFTCPPLSFLRSNFDFTRRVRTCIDALPCVELLCLTYCDELKASSATTMLHSPRLTTHICSICNCHYLLILIFTTAITIAIVL